jgi:hypothetical protein
MDQFLEGEKERLKSQLPNIFRDIQIQLFENYLELRQAPPAVAAKGKKRKADDCQMSAQNCRTSGAVESNAIPQGNPVVAQSASASKDKERETNRSQTQGSNGTICDMFVPDLLEKSDLADQLAPYDPNLWLWDENDTLPTFDGMLFEMMPSASMPSNRASDSGYASIPIGDEVESSSSAFPPAASSRPNNGERHSDKWYWWDIEGELR